MVVTGERVVSAEAGWGPTWQRHVAAYELCAPLLGPGRVLDLGCGIGHSFERLAPRHTVGVDIEADVLRGQARETVVADMRELPFTAAEFSSVLAVHSLEHVPDPGRVLAEAARVLEPAGTAVFVTPNRLTFGPPDEIVDPYHHVEFDQRELMSLCRLSFRSVEVGGIHGSERYLELVAEQDRRLARLLRLDPLRLRRLAPRRLRQRVYDRLLTRQRRARDPRAAAISTRDFELRFGPQAEALDLVAICTAPTGLRS